MYYTKYMANVLIWALALIVLLGVCFEIFNQLDRVIFKSRFFPFAADKHSVNLHQRALFLQWTSMRDFSVDWYFKLPVKPCRSLFVRNGQINANSVGSPWQHNCILASFVSRQNGIRLFKKCKYGIHRQWQVATVCNHK